VRVEFKVTNGGTEEFFKLKGSILIEEGFLEVMPWMVASDKEIPVYKVGQQVEVKQIRITEGKVSITLHH
jgi:DNA topoisomerase IA